MNPRAKIDAAVSYLQSRKIAASTAAPPVWHLCWWLGIHVPPPHFLGFFATAVLMGLPFGLLLTTVLAGALLLTGESSRWALLIVTVSSAVFFGGILAGYYRWSAWRMGLPSWSDFDPNFDSGDESW